MITRPKGWPPISSVVRLIGGPYDGEWAVTHRARMNVLSDSGQTVHRISRHDVKDWDLFRSGRTDYSTAWHDAPPWMQTVS